MIKEFKDGDMVLADADVHCTHTGSKLISAGTVGHIIVEGGGLRFTDGCQEDWVYVNQTQPYPNGRDYTCMFSHTNSPKRKLDQLQSQIKDLQQTANELKEEIAHG